MFNLHIQYAAREFFYSSGGQFCTASVHVEKKNNNPYHVGQSGGKRVTSVTGVRTRKKKKVSSCLQENCEHARVVSHKQHWWKWKHWQKKFKSHPAQLCVSSQRISNLQTPPPPPPPPPPQPSPRLVLGCGGGVSPTPERSCLLMPCQLQTQ